MNRYKSILSSVCLFLCAVCGAGELDSTVAKHALVNKLIQKKCIYIEADGTADMSMVMASGLLGRSDMLETIQQAYEDMLPEGESAEFTVKKEAEGKYFYVNRDNQETHIEEVARSVIPGERVLVALYSDGRRSFGNYQSLVQVVVTPVPEGGVSYEVCLYAYPESYMLRMFSKVPGVKRFFRKKTTEMTELTLSICQKIYEQQNPSAKHVAGL
jgi:hypothetical protein